MRMKSVVLLAVAVGCGLVAMLGVQQVLSGDEAAAAEKSAQVLVATAEILPGVELDETNTAFKQVPKETIAEGVYVTDKEQFQDRSLKVKAFPGEIILLKKLSEKGVAGISVEIPKGMRVITVKCDMTMIHSGMIRPGDRVDVLVTFKSQDMSRRMISKTRTVLEYIEVFATDSIRDAQNMEGPEIKAKNISLLVTPKQAQILKLAEDRGSLTLSLRSKTDTDEVHVGTFSETELNEAAGFGPEDSEEEEPQGPRIDDIRKFVAGEQKSQETAQTELAAATPQPDEQMWTIHIYAGDQHREEHVELPGGPLELGTEPWGGWLKKFFKGS